MNRGVNQIFLSRVGLSSYISDCGNKEDAFEKIRSESEVLEMEDSLFYSFRGITCRPGGKKAKLCFAL